MTEKKHISLSIYIDGTGNNKTNDRANTPDQSDNTTNVAKLHNLQKADAAFDFSRNGKDTSDGYIQGEGDRDAFKGFIKDLGEIDRDSYPDSLKIYHDGVGSQAVDKSKVEGAFGKGTMERVETMVNAIKAIKKAYGDDVIIDLNVVGFSRGSVACKLLMNKLADIYGKDGGIELANAVLFDPVAAIGNPLSDVHTGMDLDYPEELITEKTRIFEALAANEERETFSLLPYQDAAVFQKMFPGAHAQIGGGYHNDILHVGSLVTAYEFLKNGSDKNYSSGALPTDTVVKLRLYNAVIENPLLVRALITDSRKESEDLIDEGNSNFPGENIADPASPRHIVDEREELQYNEFYSILQDSIKDFNVLLDSELFEEEAAHHSNLLANYGGGDLSIFSIEQQHYSKIKVPDDVVKLPDEIEALVSEFEDQIGGVFYDSSKMDDYEYLSSVINDFRIISETFQGKVSNYLAENKEYLTDEENTILASLKNNAEILDARIDNFDKQQRELENEILSHTNQVINKAVSIAYFEELEAAHDLKKAIEEGDTVEILQTITDYISHLDNLFDKSEYDNSRNVLNGRKDNEDAGIVDEQNELLLAAVSDGLAFIRALDKDDSIEQAISALNMVQNLKEYLDYQDKNNADSTDRREPDENAIYDQSGKVISVTVNLLSFAQAVESGSELDALVEGAKFLDSLNFDDAPSIDKLISFVSLYKDITSFEDTLESGDTIEIALASAEMAMHAVESYNIIANTISIPSIPIESSSYLGSIVAGVQMGRGDNKGAALTTLTNKLMTSGDKTQMGIGVAIQVCNAAGWLDNEEVDEQADNPFAQSSLNYATCTDELSGYSAAVVQLCDGKTEDAIITGITTFALSTKSAAGYIGAAMLQLVRCSYLEDHPPNASAIFSLDTEGNIQMRVSGDKEMKGAAEYWGNTLLPVLNGYKDSGGRVEITGTLPRLRLIEGETAEIRYASSTGGKINIMIDDLSDAPRRMQGALIARDRGERLDSAVKVASLPGGDIDWSKVDNIMAGYGFGKRGENYIFGEIRELYGTTTGTGVFRGGGQQGAVGKTHAAKPSDIQSLPIPAEQLPAQSMGKITKTVSLNNLFSSPGAELLAMSLILQHGIEAFASQAPYLDNTQTSHVENIPLNPFLLEDYYADPDGFAQPNNGAGGAFEQVSFPEMNNTVSMQQFFSEHWDDLLAGYSWEIGITADSFYRVKEDIGYNGLLSDGSVASWWNKEQADIFFQDKLDAAQKSTTGGKIAENSSGGNQNVPTAEPGVEQGAVFLMAEDSILRFLQTDLTSNTLLGDYSNKGDEYRLVSFWDVQNGRIWQEPNGDLRFEPLADFVGNASFRYTLEAPNGERVEKQGTILVRNVNDKPEITADHRILQEGESFYLDTLLQNDSDLDGDTLLIDHLRGVQHGEISLVNNRMVFTPEKGYAGDINFSYWVRDHINSYPVMGEVILSYQDQNTGPYTENDRFLIQEDTVLKVLPSALLSNDYETDGEGLHFSGTGPVRHGSLVQKADGTIVFTPEQNYAGTEAGFSYMVEDSSGNSSSGWVNVDVLDKREAPVITSGVFHSIREDEPVTFSPDQVADFIWDADGDTVHLDLIENVFGGTITIQNGYYTFVPDANYTGPASFDYRANDNHHGTVDGHLEFAVTPVNDPVEIGEDLYTTQEEQMMVTSISELLANDSDVDGAVVEFVSLGSVAHGTIDKNGDQISFIPEKDYVGNEAGFEYIVRDSEGLLTTGWVTITVENVNDAPVIVNNLLTSREDEAILFDQTTLARFVNDADGDNLSISGMEVLSGGTVTEDNGIFTYTPPPDYHGDGKVQITLNDGNGEELISEIDLKLLAVDDPANLDLDSFATNEEQELTIDVTDLLANDSDPDGALEFAGLGAANHGTVELTTQDKIVFIPDQNYFGTKAGFQYLVKDVDGNQAIGEVAIEVVNSDDPPQIISTTYTSLEDEKIVFTAASIARFIHDLDGDSITLTSITDVKGGTVSEQGGVFTFTPEENYHGPASFSYSATDVNGGQVHGVLNIRLLAMNDSTCFGVDLFFTDEEQSVTTSVEELIANDVDMDGDLSFIGVGEVKHGQVKLGQGGSIQFIPDKDYFGGDAGFEYTVEDQDGNQASSWVTIEVKNINDTPVILGNRLFIEEDEQFTLTSAEIGKFITDADGELFSVDRVSNVQGGRAEFKNGLYTFIPDADFYGEASFDYNARNLSGEEVSDTMYLGIKPVNDLPETTYHAASGIEDYEVVLNVTDLMAGVQDVEDGKNVKFGGIESSLHGDAYVDQQGIIHFLPDQDYFGNAAFSYTVIDSEGGVSEGFVGLTISGVNDAPVAVDDEKIVAWSNNKYENVYLATTFLGNDVDVDSDPLKIVSVTAAAHGSVSLDVDGNIHYVAPEDDWIGIDTFTYTITDGNGEIATATAKLDVKINTSPDVYPEILYTKEDEIIILDQGDLLANDSDVDGDFLKITSVDQAEHCTVELLTDGSIKFIPEHNYNNLYPGSPSFRYTVTDGISDPVTAIAFFDLEPVNDAPILRPERINGAVEDNSFKFFAADLLANDTDVEMESQYEEDSISFAGVFDAAHGAITADDSGTIFYTPDPDFCRTETFKYKVVDAQGAESIVTSEIWVEPVNDLPEVEEDIATSVAEDQIWNHYSIRKLVSNDFDVDGDRLNIKNAHILTGRGDVKISGGNLSVKPRAGEDYMEIGYTVTDGNGGDTLSKLTIPSIKEHNFAPEFSGLYRTIHHFSTSVWFCFHVGDRNGGNNWVDMGDIASISAGNLHTNYGSSKLVERNEYGHFSFHYWPTNETPVYANFTLTATDYQGASSTIFVNFMKMNRSVGNHYYPVVLDLDDDGVELLSASDGVLYDWKGEGEKEITGWVDKDDGFLVYDHDGDKRVTQANELVLKDYNPDAETDLDGLKAFDTNNNGAFDHDDEEWNDFGVWQDENSNGITDDGEFRTLDQEGICSIDLESDEQYELVDDNVVYGNTTYEKNDGTTHSAHDVGLNGEMKEVVEVSGKEELTDESLEVKTELTEEEIDRLFVQLQSDIAATIFEQDCTGKGENSTTVILAADLSTSDCLANDQDSADVFIV